jgi:hypothetical protein
VVVRVADVVKLAPTPPQQAVEQFPTPQAASGGRVRVNHALPQWRAVVAMPSWRVAVGPAVVRVLLEVLSPTAGRGNLVR